MLGEGTPVIFVTFLFAIIGYVGLTAVVVLTVRGQRPDILWRVVALIILTHVFMVWVYRYDGHFELAVRNGYAGFLIFHTAVVLIILSHFITQPWSQRFIHISFLIVTMGAVGASFRYPVVSMYRYIVIPCGLIGIVGLVKFYILDRGRSKDQLSV